MKFLIVTHYSRFLLQFEVNNVKMLQKMGYEVHYATNYKQEDIYENVEEKIKKLGVILHQVDFVRSPYAIKENICAYQQLKKIMQEVKFAGVHCHTPMGGLLARIVANKTNTSPVIYTAHGFHFYKGAPLANWLFYYPVEWLCSWWTDVQITITKEDFNLARRRFHSKSVKYIPGVGIDVKRFEEVGELDSKCYTMKLLEEDMVMLSVGELNRNKNHEAVIRAIAELADKHIHYYIAGEGELKEYLQKLINELSIETQVHLLGFCSNIPSLLQNVDVYIHPSFREGLSVAIMEAMASGKPIICADIRGNNDLLLDEKGGFLVKNGQYVKAIQQMMEQKKKWIEFGEFNRKKVMEFSQEIVNKKMQEIYLEQIEQV